MKTPSVPLTMNTATDAIIVKRSKVRESPKPKKFSRLKKLILTERAEKWKSRASAARSITHHLDEVKDEEHPVIAKISYEV